MMLWQAYTRSPEIQTLGWTLVNFVWQGTLIALTLKCGLTALRHHGANLRYWVAAAALALLMLVPLLTFFMPHEARPPVQPRAVAEETTIDASPALPAGSADDQRPAARRAPVSPQPEPDPEMSRLDRWTRAFQARLPEVLPSWMAAFWILGIVLTGIRALGGLIQANLLRNGARELRPGSDLRRFIVTSGAAGRVRLLESALISVPTVIGWLRPVVLFPAGAEIETNHMQALLAHELEHVRRRDYPVNLLQTAVEALLFFHPGVWWVSAQMRTERECCCDDAAVRTCGDLRVYLRALAEAEQRRSGTRLAVALSGTSLLQRIRRLTEMRTVQSHDWKTWSAGISVFAVLLAFSAAAILMAFIPVQAEPAATQAPAREVEMKAVPKPASTASPKQVSEVPVSRPATVTRTAAQEFPKTELDRLRALLADLSARYSPNHPEAIRLKSLIARQERDPKTELDRLRTQLADLSARYSPNHPEVIRLKSMIARQEREVTAGAQPQENQEKITGTILDPTGGVIPGATVSILDARTNELLGTTFSAANGSFQVLPPAGDYYLKFTVPGFQPLMLSSSQFGPSPLMIEMELGQIKETVTVVTAAPTTASTRASREPIRVGGNVHPPKLVQRVEPIYPPEARAADVEGAVVVSALIDTEGNVTNPVVLSGHPLLRNAALTCVRQWRYQPGLINGEGWPARLSITIVFKLQR